MRIVFVLYSKMNYAVWVAMIEWFWLTPTIVFIPKTHLQSMRCRRVPTLWAITAQSVCIQRIYIHPNNNHPTTAMTNTNARNWIARIYAKNHAQHQSIVDYHISHICAAASTAMKSQLPPPPPPQPPLPVFSVCAVSLVLVYHTMPRGAH